MSLPDSLLCILGAAGVQKEKARALKPFGPALAKQPPVFLPIPPERFFGSGDSLGGKPPRNQCTRAPLPRPTALPQEPTRRPSADLKSTLSLIRGGLFKLAGVA